MKPLKRFFKQHSHNALIGMLAGLGRSVNRFYENRNHDIQSNGELFVLQQIAKIKPDVVIDAGANVGHYTLLLNKLLPSCTIYAFEPVMETYQLLEHNCAPWKNIHTICKGLYSKKMTTEINLYSSNTHSSLYDIKGVHYKRTTQKSIELTTGDYFLAEHQIEKLDFLKIDIEGAEYDALLGFENALKKGSIKALQFEYGYINITNRKLLIDFYDLLTAYQYCIGKIYPRQVDFREYAVRHEDFIGPNYIAVHSSAERLINLLSKK